MLRRNAGSLVHQDVHLFLEVNMDRPREATEPDVEEWIETLVSICLSLEVRELLEQLEKEDHAFPQTVIQKEED